MTFIQSIKTCFRKYFVFKGRATRSEFWWFQLFTVFVFILGMLIDNVLGYDALDYITPVASGSELLLAIPVFSVTSRRLHDWGMSGWIQLPLVFFYLDYLDLFISGFSDNTIIDYSINGGGICYLIIFALCIKRGDPLTNKHGPSYQSEGVSEVFS